MNSEKAVAYLLPIVAIILFLVVMLSPSIFKGQGVYQEINRLTQDVNKEDWNSANARLLSLDKEWQKVINRIQFGAEREEINSLSRSLARLKGIINAEDKDSALIELAEINHYWLAIGR